MRNTEIVPHSFTLSERANALNVVTLGVEALLREEQKWRRIKLIERESNQSEESTKQDEDKMVLQAAAEAILS